MLITVSPAKTLDFSPQKQTRKFTQPDFLDESTELVGLLRSFSSKQLGRLMNISPKLADENVERFAQWSTPFDRSNAKQAVLAFRGEVYLGLQPEHFRAKEFQFAQRHLRILSGLYGVLRPLDLIQPYRLEMGTKLRNRRGRSLYDFWGRKIARTLQDEVADHRRRVIINLASNEYFKAVGRNELDIPVVTPVFKERKKGGYQLISFFAKKARGTLASYIIRNRLQRPEQLVDFDEDGYEFNPELSSTDQPTFTRG